MTPELRCRLLRTFDEVLMLERSRKLGHARCSDAFVIGQAAVRHERPAREVMGHGRAGHRMVWLTHNLLHGAGGRSVIAVAGEGDRPPLSSVKDIQVPLSNGIFRQSWTLSRAPCSRSFRCRDEDRRHPRRGVIATLRGLDWLRATAAAREDEARSRRRLRRRMGRRQES